MMSSRSVCAAVLTVALALRAGAPLVAQEQQSVPPPPPPATSPNTPENLDRIKRLIDRPPALKIDENRLRFYVEVLGKFPTFEAYVKGQDLTKGPRKDGPMTHAEFLSVITPRELYSTAGIKPTEMLQFAITNWLIQSVATKAYDKLRTAYNERQIREIRERIEAELAALKAKSGGG
jgi:hypothetical protein